MTDSVTLSEADLALVEALQVSPRAPWSAVASATGSSPATVARRWRRLVEGGAAWVTGTPGVSVWNAQCVAFTGLRCSPGRILDVATTLAGDPHALSVELTTGVYDVFVTVAAADLRALSRYLLDRVTRVPGVTEVQTRICTHLYRDGSSWRLGTLPQQAASRLPERVRSGSSPTVVPELRPSDARMLVQLGLDGRSSYAALAEAGQVSEATARRRLPALLAAGMVVLRTEVAANLTSWQVPVMLSIDAPSARLADTAIAIARLREVRMCATLAGTPAIIASAWLRDLAAIHELETRLAHAIPDLTVTQRLLTLRTVKRMGRLLDEEGRCLATVPMDVWADPVPAPAERAGLRPTRTGEPGTATIS